MTLPPPTYDLVVLLDPLVEESVRAKVLADTREQIAARGEVVRDDDWGQRALAYPIDRKPEAEYHLLQFTVTTPELLGDLHRTLQLADEILRFRIIKLAPGTPAAPDMGGGAGDQVAGSEPQAAQAAPAPAAPEPTAPEPAAA